MRGKAMDECKKQESEILQTLQASCDKCLCGQDRHAMSFDVMGCDFDVIWCQIKSYQILITSRYYPSPNNAHQHISTSTHQHINTSAHQHISTSTHQHISPSAHQHAELQKRGTNNSTMQQFNYNNNTGT
ncbi:hypothetical protein HELRODRAFT_168581 [Helobdella robusta]|uniref:Uncharacterized protein n=1 Tax=Helobdella robusta TaxID=6412 RepID=T1F0R6_HELRO|nr:hypothetical protein HELRODRAFT_168581 [Helobdella robusta]ESO09576.1 hypothetical protein HELRODRAFT_168581 [Helobdella robusta]